MLEIVAGAGKLLIFVGLVITAVGIVLVLGGKTGLPLGRLPGDITYKGRNFTFYFPLTTGLLLSLLISLLVWLLHRR
jgi:hypothetical protein